MWLKKVRAYHKYKRYVIIDDNKLMLQSTKCFISVLRYKL